MISVFCLCCAPDYQTLERLSCFLTHHARMLELGIIQVFGGPYFKVPEL